MPLINIEPETLAHRAEPVEDEPEYKPEPVEVAEIKVELESLDVWEHIHVGELASIYQGDCIEVMATFPENSIDAIVTDPPYGLQFMGKGWDNVEYEFHKQWAEQAFRVLKPGGHLLSFGGSRTYHWMAAGVEDAGFEIRDMIQWLYGQGFPKSMNVGKKLDGWEGWGTALKPAQEPIVLARKPLIGTVAENILEHGIAALNIDASRVGMSEADAEFIHKTARPNSAGQEHEGSVMNRPGTPTVNVHKDGRFPANVILSHHPECEEVGVKKVKGITGGYAKSTGKKDGTQEIYGAMEGLPDDAANVKVKGDKKYIAAGSVDEDGMETVEAWECHKDCAIRRLDEQTGALRARGNISPTVGGGGMYGHSETTVDHGPGDKGGASRFFYNAKASKSEREKGLIGQLECLKCGELDSTHHTTEKGKKQKCHRNEHPTVKPVALMEYLVRLVTPPGGMVLDPFLGSGTTGIATVRQGFHFVGIEKEEDYLPLAKARIADG